MTTVTGTGQRVLVLGDHPALQDWLRDRKTHGRDYYDEVWAGVYHVAPNARVEHGRLALQVMVALEPRAVANDLYSSGPFNLGGREDYRVPDGGWFAAPLSGAYAPTAALVLEVLSPEDETWEKFGFYARHQVAELLVAHPTERWVRCWTLDGDSYQERGRSALLGIDMTELVTAVRWP